MTKETKKMSENDIEALAGQILALRHLQSIQMKAFMELADDSEHFALWAINALREIKEEMRSRDISNAMFESYQQFSEALVQDIKEVQSLSE